MNAIENMHVVLEDILGKEGGKISYPPYISTPYHLYSSLDSRV